MIFIIFSFGNEIIKVTVDGKDISFSTSQSPQEVKLDRLRLSKEGCLKEFPDLREDQDWRNKSIERFNQKIQRMKNEEEISQYLIEDLRKVGYIPMYKQRKGFRAERIK